MDSYSDSSGKANVKTVSKPTPFSHKQQKNSSWVEVKSRNTHLGVLFEAKRQPLY